MRLSTFFADLNASYQAELDDLRSDSEGRDVLRRRLAEKRAQIGFLCQLIETNPELVAVAFHGGFHFASVGALEHLIAQDAEDLPPWAALADCVNLTPWAQELAQLVLAQPEGDRFMVVAAVLEYLQQRPSHAARSHEAESVESADATPGAARRRNRHADEHDPDEALDVEGDPEAAEDWLADQGFDRKE